MHECSRAGCRAEATTTITWRNPKIHDESRKKVWIACDAHNTFLIEFLTSRGFPVEVTPFIPEETA
ncbi:hypothetical protein D9V32_13175 [Mycetocola tolaasinivorans]|uniref:Acetone carboxylase n=1 Tax=Mycetocola tolaasinivorans TaxID=76635 RepID=A0A3L7A2Y4_9MICO|nr:hypothetical protein D9V32_13175 [Mycetocola tolaasinivorans]